MLERLEDRLTPSAVSGLSPNSGPIAGGGPVYIYGSGFTGATAVSFGSVAASGFSVMSGTEIMAGAPAEAAGVVNVVVTAPSGVSPVTSADQYTYNAPPAPAVTSVSPNTGLTTGGGGMVQISGSGFYGPNNTSDVTGVSFGTVSAGYSVMSNGVIDVYSPPAQAAGTVDVKVTSTYGQSAVVTADKYTYTAPPPPTVTSVSPNTGLTTGGGGTVVIDGSGFYGPNGTSDVTGVSFGTVGTTGYSVMSNAVIDISLPPAQAAGIVDVTVTTTYGTSAVVTADKYTYTAPPPPAVTSVSPNSGLTTGGGGMVQISGSGFYGPNNASDVTGVSFGTVNTTSYSVQSNGVIYVSPPAQAAGTVDVTVTSTYGTSAVVAADKYTYTSPPPPAVTSVSPNTGLTTGGGEVQINGSGFYGPNGASDVTGVSFGTVNTTSYSVQSNGVIYVSAPAAQAAGMVDVTVSTTYGISAINGGDKYTYTAPPPPAVTSLSPNSGTTAGGAYVAIDGSGFTGATGVTFGSVASAMYYLLNDGVIDAYAPAQAAGTVDVTVSTANGTSVLSSADQFTYVAPPTAVSDIYSVLASGTITVNAENGVLSNDIDPAEATLTAFRVAGPSYGALTLNPDGSFAYTPGAGFAGADSFTYEAYNGTDYSAPATVTLTTAPVASDAQYSVLHDTVLTVDAAPLGLLIGASDADGGPMTAAWVAGPGHGSLTLNSDGSFVYTPQAGYVGGDSFTYAVQEGSRTSNPATVTLSVTDQAPNAGDDWFQVHAGQTLTADAPGLSEVATDADFDPLTFQEGTGPTNGTLNLQTDGTFVYQPNAGFVGTDTFTYRAFDGALYSPTYGTATINVEDLAPTAAPASFGVAAGGSLTVGAGQGLLNNAFQPEGDALTAVLVAAPQDAAPQAGSFVLNPDGTFVYTPAPGYTGPDAFTYAVTDGTLTSAPATVSLNVTGVPVANPDFYVIGEDGNLTVDAADGVLANDFNPVGNPNDPPMTAQLEQGVNPSVGTLTFNQDGSFTFSLNPNSPPPQGPITFGYQDVVGAGAAGSLQAIVTLLVQKPNVGLTESDFNKPLAITADTSNVQYNGRYVPPSAALIAALGVGGAAAATLAPTAYVEGQTVSIKAIFSTDSSYLFAGRTVTVVGVSNAADIPNIVGTATASGNTLVMQSSAGGAGQTGVVLPNTVEAFNDLAITWYVLPPGVVYDPTLLVAQQIGGWVAAGTSHYELYLTYKAPPVNQKLYWTVLDVGTRAAAGQTTDDGVIQAVIDKFETRKINQAGVGGALGPMLTYYANWDIAVPNPPAGLRTTSALLKTGDGNCEAWAKFFLDVLMAQGITLPAQPLYDIAPNKGLDNTIYVKGWQTPAAPNTDAPTRALGYLYYNTAATFIPWKQDATTKAWSYDWTLETVKQGVPLPGQGNTNPVANFPNHEIVQITLNGNTVLFDPSYGVEYQGATDAARLLAFQQGAIAYTGLTIMRKGIVIMTFRPVPANSLVLTDATKAYK